jgi:hypothetical protein
MIFVCATCRLQIQRTSQQEVCMLCSVSCKHYSKKQPFEIDDNLLVQIQQVKENWLLKGIRKLRVSFLTD